LGEIPEDMVGEIHDIMRNSFAGFKPFEVSLQGVGVFPSMKYMRVVWVGFKDNREKLMQMQHVLEKNLAKLRFKLEKRFDPHLTIGRVRSAKGKTELMNFVLGHEDTEFGTVAIDKVVLKKSVLTPKGPIYSMIKEVELKRSQKTPR
jgi:2'-5' RNA ligase